MSIIHILNVADLAFMAAGVAAALLMIVVGARDGARQSDTETTSSKTGRGTGT